MNDSDTQMWFSLLKSRGINQALAEKWAEFARPTVRLLPGVHTESDSNSIGASKLGGSPDMPVGMPWPIRPAYSYPEGSRRDVDPAAWEPQPLAFMTQINLSEIEPIGCDLPLPKKGLLLFFYDNTVQPWGYDPFDYAGTCVMYVEANANLRRYQSAPLMSPAQSLEFLAGDSLPDGEWIHPLARTLPGYTRAGFFDEIGGLEDEDYERMAVDGHCFGGWPSTIQGPMELGCQLASNGIYLGDAGGHDDPRVPELKKGADEWRLLLQLDSDEEHGWNWGDGGRIYFWCRNSDIEARRFDRVWTVLQCS